MPKSRRRIPRELWPKIAVLSRTESLRQLALAYGVSYEAIRQIVLESMKHPIDHGV